MYYHVHILSTNSLSTHLGVRSPKPSSSSYTERPNKGKEKETPIRVSDDHSVIRRLQSSPSAKLQPARNPF